MEDEFCVVQRSALEDYVRDAGFRSPETLREEWDVMLPPRAPWRDPTLTRAMDRWRAVAMTFPTVRDHAVPMFGIDKLDPITLDGWCAEYGSDGAKHTVAFLCHLWNGRYTWKAGAFSLRDALDRWDGRHRLAFAAWAVDPVTF